MVAPVQERAGFLRFIEIDARDAPASTNAASTLVHTVGRFESRDNSK